MVNGPGQLPLARDYYLCTISCHITVACAHCHIMDFWGVELPFLVCVTNTILVGGSPHLT